MKPVRRYHFHFPGVLFAVVTLLLGIGAINSQNNLLFLLFGLGVGAYAVSGLVSGSMMMGVSACRIGRGEAQAGGQARIGYEVRSTGRWVGAFALEVEEIEPGGRGLFAKKRSGWDGRMGAVRASVAHVGAGRRARATGRGDALRRGVCELEGIRVSSRFPLGLMRKSVSIHAPGRLIVRPRVVELVPGLIEGCAGDDRFASGSGRTPQRVGEFFGLRDYVPGDSPRTIAWRASARAGMLVVRECADPVRSGVWVALSLGRGRDDAWREEAERAISLAASLVVQGEEAGIDVGLAVIDRGVGFVPGSGRGHREGVLDALGELDIERQDSARVAAPEPGIRDTVILVRAGSAEDGYEGRARLVLRGSDIERLTVRTAGGA